ncbi:hypothetical protein M501DRAFT_1004684 [Patellaria atrata CBS 101060]|uniref:EF-hand domain-containing protein n=1 Tax=Patellaria atrata CBS 101060 TaxID=1346257 RepID=A0A9P4SBZ7_9PEZI|nr:hypothetical protein M501DRAFT_1004684 [Patellaria atrata CBS 101060]
MVWSHIGRLSLFLVALVSHTSAHDDHSHGQVPISDNANWATRHMEEEHHLSFFDAGVFFRLHDFDNTEAWSRDDIARTYGLFDESLASVPQGRRDEIVNRVLALYDTDNSGTVSYDEFIAADARGVQLPDFGLGPGHHGDDEYEYEIHHFEKYHGGDDVKEEDLTHPEDIEHFKKHEKLDMEEWERERQEAWERDGGKVVEGNIPKKFRRGG